VKSKIYVLLAIVLVASLVLTFGCAPKEAAPAAPAAPIKIGCIQDITGLVTTGGSDIKTAAKVSIEQLGPVEGHAWEDIWRDSAWKTSLGVSHAEELCTSEKVDLLLSPISSAVRLGISGVAKKYGVIMFDTVAGSDSLYMENGHKYFFELGICCKAEAYSQANLCATLFPDAKTIVTIAPDYVWGRDEVKYFKEWLKVLCPEKTVIKEYWPELQTPDYSSYITSIMADKPDILETILYAADNIGFFKQFAAQDPWDKMYINAFFEGSSRKPNAALFPPGVVGGYARCPILSIDTPVAKKFVMDFHNSPLSNGAYPAHVETYTYDALWIYRQAVEEANGSLDDEILVPIIQGGTFDTLRGKAGFIPYCNVLKCPTYNGLWGWRTDYENGVLDPLHALDLSEVYPTKAEVEAARAAK